MSDSILRERSKDYAKKIVLLCRTLRSRKTEGALVDQLLRSGTSVGANVFEAQYAQGTKDFISKFEIALKECNESAYWVELLFEVGSLTEEEYQAFCNDAKELRRMLVSTVTTLKAKGQ